MRKFQLISALLMTTYSSFAFADDNITGLWKNIDDKTGSSKAILEIRQ